MMNVFDDLYSTFARDAALAKGMKSPNREDTIEIKAAIVGFSYNAPTEAWGMEEYECVNRVLGDSEGFSEGERLFYALSVGYLLGLDRSSKMEPLALRTALAQLPGFIFSKGGQF